MVAALGYKAGIELTESPVGQTWYCVEYSNPHTVARDFFADTIRKSPFGNRHHPFMKNPALFIFRHPLDILISEANYYHLDGKTPFYGWLNQCDFSERLDKLVSDNRMIGSLRERICAFLPWLVLPNVIPFSFEELIGAAGGGNDKDQLRLIWSIQLKLQVPGNPAEIASHVFNPDAPTFFAGQAGGYTKQLSEEFINNFSIKNSDILESLGYPVNGSSGLTEKKESRLKKIITYSQVDYNDTPINIESNFLGCNLVRYNKLIYAIPKAAGQVDLRKFSSDDLKLLPASDSVEKLKTLIILGSSKFLQREAELNQLAIMLSDGKPIDSSYQNWKQDSFSGIVEVYNGYNIVPYLNYYLALNQSVGAIDLVKNDLKDVLKQYNSDDIIIGNSIAELYNKINQHTISRQLKKVLETVNEYMPLNEEHLKADIKRVSEHIEDRLIYERQAENQRLEELKKEISSINEHMSLNEEHLKADIKRVSEHIEDRLIYERQAENQRLEELKKEISSINEHMSLNEEHLKADIKRVSEHFEDRLLNERQIDDQRLEELKNEISSINEQVLKSIESGLFNCNIDMYNNRIYAVPKSAGTIVLEELSPDVLAAIPSADSLEELKSVLILGYSEFLERQESLDLLGRMLSSEESVNHIHNHWYHSHTPCIVESYKGYNLIAYAGQYLALRQSAGKINLINNNLNELVQNYGIDDVLIGLTISELRNEINGISISQRLRHEIFKNNTQILRKIEKIEKHFEKSVELIDEQMADNFHAADDALSNFKLETEIANEKILKKLEMLEGKFEKSVELIDEQIADNFHAADDALSNFKIETEIANEKILKKFKMLEVKLERFIAKIDDSMIENSQASDLALDQLKKELINTDKQVLEKIKSIESEHERVLNLIVEQEEKLLMVKESWMLRLSGMFDQFFNGSKK